MILTLSGTTGVGKSSVARRLIEEVSRARLLSSYTTRSTRPNDLKQEYVHVSPSMFKNMHHEGRLLWWLPLHDACYGTTAESVRQALAEDEAVRLMILAPAVLSKLRGFAERGQRADRIRSVYFLKPDPEIIRERLAKRGWSAQVIERRLVECADWDDMALASSAPYSFKQDLNDLDDKYRFVLSLL